MEQKKLFECTSPCETCPYRKDVKLALWSVEEFKDLLEYEKSFMGTTYLCHKKNGSICVGFLMNQNERGLPSLALRMSLIDEREEIAEGYMNSLHCDAERFETVEEMCRANFPDEFE
jgi:hypothetical protein